MVQGTSPAGRRSSISSFDAARAHVAPLATTPPRSRSQDSGTPRTSPSRLNFSREASPARPDPLAAIRSQMAGRAKPAAQSSPAEAADVLDRAQARTRLVKALTEAGGQSFPGLYNDDKRNAAIRVVDEHVQAAMDAFVESGRSVPLVGADALLAQHPDLVADLSAERRSALEHTVRQYMAFRCMMVPHLRSEGLDQNHRGPLDLASDYGECFVRGGLERAADESLRSELLLSVMFQHGIDSLGSLHGPSVETAKLILESIRGVRLASLEKLSSDQDPEVMDKQYRANLKNDLNRIFRYLDPPIDMNAKRDHTALIKALAVTIIEDIKNYIPDFTGDKDRMLKNTIRVAFEFSYANQNIKHHLMSEVACLVAGKGVTLSEIEAFKSQPSLVNGQMVELPIGSAAARRGFVRFSARDMEQRLAASQDAGAIADQVEALRSAVRSAPDDASKNVHGQRLGAALLEIAEKTGCFPEDPSEAREVVAQAVLKDMLEELSDGGYMIDWKSRDADPLTPIRDKVVKAFADHLPPETASALKLDGDEFRDEMAGRGLAMLLERGEITAEEAKAKYAPAVFAEAERRRFT